MEDFIKSASVPVGVGIALVSFLFRDVLGNLLADLISPHLKTKVDALLSRFFPRWQRGTPEKKEEIETVVNELRSSLEQQFFAALNDIRLRIKAVLFLILGSLSFSTSIGFYLLRQVKGEYPMFFEMTFLVLGFLCFAVIIKFYLPNDAPLHTALREARKP